MPVCNVHARPTASGMACISCLRRTLRDPRQRPSFAHLRDDPYFYWYFDGGDWAEEYDRYDYALFDAGVGDASPDLGMMPDEPWEGS